MIRCPGSMSWLALATRRISIQRSYVHLYAFPSPLLPVLLESETCYSLMEASLLAMKYIGIVTIEQSQHHYFLPGGFWWCSLWAAQEHTWMTQNAIIHSRMHNESYTEEFHNWFMTVIIEPTLCHFLTKSDLSCLMVLKLSRSAMYRHFSRAKHLGCFLSWWLFDIWISVISSVWTTLWIKLILSGWCLF